MTSEPAPVSKAREVVAPWLEHAWVDGAYLTGSSLRPWADADSDLDIIVISNDEHYAAMRPKDRYVMGIDRGPPRRKIYDLIVSSWTRLEQIRSVKLDHLRYAMGFARVLHDRTGRLAATVQEIAALPTEIRDERLRVHYCEYLWDRGKAKKCVDRGHVPNARMANAVALGSLMKCLFLAANSWAAKGEWAVDALRALDVPEELTSRVEWVWTHPETIADETLHALVDAYLVARGFEFHRDPVVLVKWLTTDPHGLAAMDRWMGIP